MDVDESRSSAFKRQVSICSTMTAPGSRGLAELAALNRCRGASCRESTRPQTQNTRQRNMVTEVRYVDALAEFHDLA